MRTKAYLIPIVAVFAIFLMGIASAGDLVDGSISTEFNEIVLATSGMTMAGSVDDTVPVNVAFKAIKDESDVRVKVWLEGYRDDISVKTGRFNIVDGTTYIKKLSLELPSDLKNTSKIYTLHVSISSADGYDETEYELRLQRESYQYDILSVDYTLSVSSGDVVPVTVVINNQGFERSDDGYVVVSIPELGITSNKGYFGDLIPVEDCNDDNCEDEEDSVQKTVYLNIPESVEQGSYDLVVKVYNKDSISSVTETIKVDQTSTTTVLAGIKNQDLKAGETKTYDLILVNSADNVKVFNLVAVSGSALEVSVPSVVTVGPKSSTTVPVSVRASNDAEVGAYVFSVDVDGEQVVLGANVTEKGMSASAVALTVVLVIVFVVLLAVLVILLTRKEDKPIEEVETSYY